VVAVALFSVLPGIWEWYAAAQLGPAAAIPGWVPVSLLAGLILGAYGVYLAQLPDWSALWMGTLVLLLMAGCYAAVLATTLLGSYETSLVAGLQFGDKLSGQRAALWCGSMVLLSSLAAFFTGQEAVRWYNAWRRAQRSPEASGL
jgi:hypothetical protein